MKGRYVKCVVLCNKRGQAVAMKGKLILPRRIFRLHDNPLYEEIDPQSDIVCFLVDTGRIPMGDLGELDNVTMS